MTFLNIFALFVVLISGIPQITIAQNSNLTFGIRAGAGVSYLTSKNTYNNSSAASDMSIGFSFNAGGLMNIALNKRWSIQPELLYNAESAKHSETFTRVYENGTFDGKGYFRVNYNVTSIRMPVLLKLTTGESKAGQFGLLVGPSFSYVLSIKNYKEFDPPINNLPTTDVDDLTDLAKRFQIGISLGADYRILDNLFADARINYNFTKHIEANTYYSSFSNLLVGVGYLF